MVGARARADANPVQWTRKNCVEATLLLAFVPAGLAGVFLMARAILR